MPASPAGPASWHRLLVQPDMSLLGARNLFLQLQQGMCPVSQQIPMLLVMKVFW